MKLDVGEDRVGRDPDEESENGMRGSGAVGRSLTFSFLLYLTPSTWPAEPPLSPHCLVDQRIRKELIGAGGVLSAESCVAKVS
jgi:hypothetical protein